MSTAKQVTKRVGRELTVRVTEVTKHGLIRFEDTGCRVGELEDKGTIEHPKRIRVGTLIDIKGYLGGGSRVVWVGIAPHYSNYGA
jgi:hypothetical protein